METSIHTVLAALLPVLATMLIYALMMAGLVVLGVTRPVVVAPQRRGVILPPAARKDGQCR